jgi:hypothetical protein
MWIAWYPPTVPLSLPFPMRVQMQAYLSSSAAYISHLDSVVAKIDGKDYRYRGSSMITSMCWSPCGRHIIIAFINEGSYAVVWTPKQKAQRVIGVYDMLFYVNWHRRIGIVAVDKTSVYTISNSEPYHVLQQRRCDRQTPATVDMNASGTRIALGYHSCMVVVKSWDTFENLWIIDSLTAIPGKIRWMNDDMLFLTPYSVNNVALFKEGQLIWTHRIEGIDTDIEAINGKIVLITLSNCTKDRIHVFDETGCVRLAKFDSLIALNFYRCNVEQRLKYIFGI